MNWTINEYQGDAETKRHAGGKAREDISAIFLECGFSQIETNDTAYERKDLSGLEKLKSHYKVARAWRDNFSVIKPGDTLVLQFPVMNHTLFLNRELKRLKKNNIRIYAFIHDLECLRMGKDKIINRKTRWRMRREEIDELHTFDGLVVHNSIMKRKMAELFGINDEKMIELKIFDYITKEGFSPHNTDQTDKCIIAGNLRRGKSGYVYKLPEAPDFELYGVNYEGNDKPNIYYRGSFLADELPFHLKGGFGVVWDGDSADTCSGVWGEYLRYNNPHKTSLYLACGIPVIIWEEAALAEYVVKNEVGVTVKSLHDVERALEDVTVEEYIQMRSNAIKLSMDLRKGENTKRALKALGILS